MVAGYLAEVLTTATNGSGGVVAADYYTGVSVGIAVYLATYYLARFTWYRGLDRAGQGKVYTTGVGSFIIIFLFTWMILFTLQVAGYPV